MYPARHPVGCCKSSTLHVFQGDCLWHIVDFPEDISLLESATGHPSAESVWFLVVTAASRAWLLIPDGGHAQHAQSSNWQHADDAAASGTIAITATAGGSSRGHGRNGSLQLHWQGLEGLTRQAANANGLHCYASASHAALLLPPGCAASFEPLHCGALAAQVVWEHLLSVPLAAANEAVGLFHDLSQLDRQHSAAMALFQTAPPSLPDVFSAQTWAASELPPGLGSITSVLHVTPTGGSGGISGSGLRCSSRAVLHAQLYTALLSRGGCAQHVASPEGCLLAGDALGRVWALPLGSHAALRAYGSSRAAVMAAAEPAVAGSQAQQGPLTALLFDLQQPILAILPMAAQAGEGAGHTSEPCGALLLVSESGQLVRVSARAGAAGTQPNQASAGAVPLRASKAPALATQRLRVQAPVASAAVAHGLLYFTSGGVSYAAALPPEGDEGEGSSREGSGALLLELREVPLHGMGAGVHLLAAAQPRSSSSLQSTAEKGAAGKLVALCSSGCLLSAPLLPWGLLHGMQPRLSTAEARSKATVKPFGLIIGRMQGCMHETPCRGAPALEVARLKGMVPCNRRC